jgi:hypothetical protein
MGDARWQQLDLSFDPPTQQAMATPSPPAPNSALETEAHRQRITGYLTMRMCDPVDLVFTNNRSTIISAKHQKGRYSVRLHRLFRHADELVLNHLSSYLMSPTKTDSRVLDRFIARHRKEIDAKSAPKVAPLKAKGRYHDLTSVLAAVNETYFQGRVDVRIGWGSAPARKRTRRRRRSFSRALATYYYNTQTIKVSPVLDAENVPSYVLQWIVYHELLHHVLPIKKVGSRHLYHSRQFRALERAFVHYEKAKAWEESHLEQLLF